MLTKGAECDDEGVKDRVLEPLDECVSYIQVLEEPCYNIAVYIQVMIYHAHNQAYYKLYRYMSR